MGALTLQSYVFVSRPWELNSIESIDVFDSLGSNVSVDVYSDNVVRILPSINDGTYEEWISNSTRFSYDGLTIQRIGFPLLRVKLEFGVCKRPFRWLYEFYLCWGSIRSFSMVANINGPCFWLDPYVEEGFAKEYFNMFKYGYLSLFGYPSLGTFLNFYVRRVLVNFGTFYLVAGWEFVFFYLLIVLRCAYLRFCEGVCGFLLEGESIAAFNYFLASLGSANMMCGTAFYFDVDLKSGYLFNGEVTKVDLVRIVMLVGLNPRLEFPLLNVRLRRSFLRRNKVLGVVSIYSLGLSLNYITYGVENLGNSVRILLGIMEGKCYFCQNIVWSVQPVRALILLGMGSLLRSEGSLLVEVVSIFCFKEFVGFSIIHEISGSISAMDLGFIPGIHSSFISSFGGVPFDVPYESYNFDLIRCGWCLDYMSTVFNYGIEMPLVPWVYGWLYSCTLFCSCAVSYSGWYLLENSPIPIFYYKLTNSYCTSFVYLLGADDVVDFNYIKLKESVNYYMSSWSCIDFYNPFSLYQGHHWEVGASRGDLVLPSLLFVETEGIYLNYAGESRHSVVAVSSYGEAESAWDIISALEASVQWGDYLRIYWTKFCDWRASTWEVMFYSYTRWDGYEEMYTLIYFTEILFWDGDADDWYWIDSFYYTFGWCWFILFPDYVISIYPYICYANPLGCNSMQFEILSAYLDVWFDIGFFLGGLVFNCRYTYLWRLAPYFCNVDLEDNVYCEGDNVLVGWNSVCWSSFLLNTLWGVLVDDYSSIDIVGRSSSVLCSQSVNSLNVDVSFSFDGVYIGVASYN